MSTNRFTDRRAAGRALGAKLAALQLSDPVVLALPRGGVPVAVEVALVLHAPIDLVFVRKIGLPNQPELAVAAVVDGGAAEIVINNDVAISADVADAYIDDETDVALVEIERRRKLYLQGRTRVGLEARELVLVDDGIATGASIRAAIAALRRKAPKRLILAVPVAPQDVLDALYDQVDDIICLSIPHPFYAVGEHYRDFHQLQDDEVVRLLKEVDAAQTAVPLAKPPTGYSSP
jgi:putative phosphoribosyl transferase